MHLPGLREWRLRRGIYQIDLAKKSGVPQYFISRIESGERRCNRAVAHRLAEALGVGLEELLTGPDLVATSEPNLRISHRTLQRTYLRILLDRAVGSSYTLMREGEFNEHCEGLSWEELIEVVSARGREVRVLEEVLREAGPLPAKVRAFLDEVLGAYPEQDIQLLAAARRREPSEEGQEALTRAMRELLL